jgi:hypothetical protein
LSAAIRFLATLFEKIQHNISLLSICLHYVIIESKEFILSVFTLKKPENYGKMENNIPLTVFSAVITGNNN